MATKKSRFKYERWVDLLGDGREIVLRVTCVTRGVRKSNAQSIANRQDKIFMKMDAPCVLSQDRAVATSSAGVACNYSCYYYVM
jgi:hypothetical protein